MDLERTDLFKRFQQSANRQLCPECGVNMTVVDCHRESGAMFVWYGCSRNNCKGQWLKKISSISSNSISEVV